MAQKYRKYQYKAKPTKFNGVTFRSKLEARWSVFFTMLGLSYIYEHEYFILPDDVYYKPDFFIDAIPYSIIEIKPTKPTKGEKDKCRELSKLDYNVMLLAGAVNPYKVQVYLFSDGKMQTAKASEKIARALLNGANSIEQYSIKDNIDNLSKLVEAFWTDVVSLERLIASIKQAFRVAHESF